MSECSLVREQMPQLLTEAVGPAGRESAHLHIESCGECAEQWAAAKQTWRLLSEVPDLAVPDRVRSGFARHLESLQPPTRTLAFRPKARTRRWLAQAAAVTLVVAGAFGAGRISLGSKPLSSPGPGIASFPIAESMVVRASDISPVIQGRPDLENVRFFETGGNQEVGLSFDLRSRMTITGQRDDKTFVNLLSYVMQDQEHATDSRSNAIQWVKDTYGTAGTADPQIVRALANVLKNDAHEGVRLAAVDTLNALPASLAPEARLALIDALKNDPNPAVRIKAVEALANLAHGKTAMDANTIDTLRQKAAQDDENPYIRVKAAEALSQIDL